MLKEWQKRILEEKWQLAEKLSKLACFIKSPMFTHVLKDDQDLLREQHEHMLAYHNILHLRISRFR